MVNKVAERETVEKVKHKRGVIAKIQDFVTMGYGTKEDLRELDSKLRNLYYEDLRDMRHVWGDVYLAVLDVGHKDLSMDFKKIIQVLDRVMEKVRHADYGYAGLMDRKGHIRENELARVFNFDQAMSSNLENIKETVKQTNNLSVTDDWPKMLAETKRIKGLLLDFENKWHEREREFRPLEI